jgi:3-phenylpropionate/trans-cinnamate dioxygenase ferredoxin component
VLRIAIVSLGMSHEGGEMSSFVDVAGVTDIEAGSLRKVDVGGLEVLLARVRGSFYAVQPLCAHMGGDLSQGALEGSTLTCPRHHSQYDVSDGHVIRWTDWDGLKLAGAKLLKSPRGLKTYPVKVEAGRVLVSAD